MHVIDKNTCKDETLVVFVTKLVLISLNHNIHFYAKMCQVSSMTVSFVDTKVLNVSTASSPITNFNSTRTATTKLAGTVTDIIQSSLCSSLLSTYKWLGSC